MKKLHKQMNSKRDEEMIPMSHSSPYSPKALKHPRSLPISLHYLFREHRLLFILVRILIGSTFFILQPSLSRLGATESNSLITRYVSTAVVDSYSPSRMSFNSGRGKTGRVPVGIGWRRLRIVVTGGAGFVDNHLVDKLIERGDEVIEIDNFFTGRQDNLVHLFSKSILRFRVFPKMKTTPFCYMFFLLKQIKTTSFCYNCHNVCFIRIP